MQPHMNINRELSLHPYVTLSPALFQLYGTFTGPPMGLGSALLWRHRANLMEMLFYAVLDSAADLTPSIEQWMPPSTQRLLEASPPVSMHVSLMRAAFTLCRRLMQSPSRRTAAEASMTTLFKRLHEMGSPMVMPALRFGVEQRVLSRGSLLRMVQASDIRSLADLELLRGWSRGRPSRR
jgi:hypothetical protein